jgi:hypothetical protein
MSNNKKIIKDTIFWVGAGLLALTGYILIISIPLISLNKGEFLSIGFITMILGLIFIKIGINSNRGYRMGARKRIKLTLFWIGVVLITICGELWLLSLALLFGGGMEEILFILKWLAIYTGLPVLIGIIFIWIGRKAR